MTGNRARFEAMWADLAPNGRNPRSGGYRRLPWSPADLTCREWFTGGAASRGLDVAVDRNGNSWAWWGDPDADDAVVTGSHLDSVPDGGAFDGPLLPSGAGHDAGVLSAAGIPAAMLFVRNPTGVSHSPAEHAELDDCVLGVDALATVLADLLCEPVTP